MMCKWPGSFLWAVGLGHTLGGAWGLGAVSSKCRETEAAGAIPPGFVCWGQRSQTDCVRVRERCFREDGLLPGARSHWPSARGRISSHGVHRTWMKQSSPPEAPKL